MTGRLGEILAARRAARRLDCPFIFHNNGAKINNFREGWYAACARAGYGKILIHDFRRSMMSNLTQAGVDLKTIMDRAGWETPNMFFRYRIGTTNDQINTNIAYEKYIEQNKEAKVTRIA